MANRKNSAKKIIEIGQTADGQNATVEFDITTDASGNVIVGGLQINKFDINRMEKTRIDKNQNLLDKLSQFDLLQERVTENYPVDKIGLDDVKALNPQIQDAGLVVSSIQYAPPKVGKIAKEVIFYFIDDFEETYSITLDVEFRLEKVEFFVLEFSREDVRINPELLNACPMQVGKNDPNAWIVNENILNSISVKEFTMKAQHTTNTPTVVLTVHARKTGNVRPGEKKYFSKTITFPTEEFAYTDAEWIFKQVAELDALSVRTLSPPKYAKDFEINFAPVKQIGGKVMDFSVVEGAKYDKNARVMTIIVKVSVFGVSEQFTKTIEFEKSYNEALLEATTQNDIIISGIEHFISTDDPEFMEDALANAFDIATPEIDVVFVEGSLVKYSNDKRLFSGRLNLIAGESYTDIAFTSTLGLGLIAPNTTGIFANLNANIPSDLMQKFSKSH